VLAAGIVGFVVSSQARGVASAQQDALVKLLEPPMTVVVKLVAVESWGPNFPAAAPLGAKWNKSAPAWQKARSAVGARLTRLVDAYAASGDLTERLQAALVKNFPGDQADALLKVLTGPDGATIIHSEALIDFMVGATRESESKPGDKAYAIETRRLALKFEEAIGSGIPRRDPAREQTAAKFRDDAMGTPFYLVWASVLGGAETAIRGGINLMLFDERAAIERDINQAIATIR
jgi:hypothetical protein